MPIPQTNIDPVNLGDNPKLYFNNYFSSDITISSDVDGSIISYFETVAQNREAALTIASAVIYTAKKLGVNPMDYMMQFMKLPKGQLSQYLVAFLNKERVGTSYLGVNNQPPISKYVQRSILP